MGSCDMNVVVRGSPGRYSVLNTVMATVAVVVGCLLIAIS